MPKQRDVGVEVDFDEKDFLPPDEREEDNPDVVFEDDEEEFEIISEDEVEVDETPPAPDPSQEQILLMKKQMDAIAAMQQQMGQQASPGQDKIAEILQRMQEPKTIPFDAKQKREEWEKNIYDKPVDTLDDYTNTYIAPAFQQLQKSITDMQRQLTRQQLANDPTNKMVLDAYGQEVDEAVKSFPNDPDGYKKAIALVTMNHLNDIMEKKQQEWMENQGQQQVNQKPVPYTGVGRQQPPPKTKKQQIVLKRQEKDAFDRAFHNSVFSDRKMFYDLVWSKRSS